MIGRAPAYQAIGSWVLIVLAVPRVLRLLYPEVWVEDDFYLESAFLVSVGMRPYLDFVHPHLPLLEWLAAGYIKLFGASHLSFEILNQAAIYLTSVLTCRLGMKVATRRSGICAAILYGFSSLVFRYHVWEREVFAGVLIVAAGLVAIDDRESDSRQGALLAGLFAAAAAIKLTSLISAAVVLGYVALARRRLAAALICGVEIAVLIGLLCAFCYWRYGFDFIFQTFFFHLMKGRDSAASLATYPAQILDLLAPLFLLGLTRIAIEHRIARGTGLILALVAANYLFFGFLSPTVWAHNYLDWLPFIAVIAGLGLDRLIAAQGAILSESGRTDWAWLAGGAALIIVSLATITPLVNENWLRRSIYGFGFVPREELARVSMALRDASAPEDQVIAPAFACFEANRIELIRFPETFGVNQEALQEYRRLGLLAARSELGRADFFSLIGTTAHFWADPMAAAISDGKVSAVITDPPILLLPLVRPPLVNIHPELLADHGYDPLLRTEHFVVWARAGGQQSAARALSK